MTIIKTENLSKSFRSYKKDPGIIGSLKSLFHRKYQIKEAVKDFSFSIEEGEILGLLGPNGAGKTTLMKMFTGIIVPSEGHLNVLGYKPWDRDKEFRKKIALVMGQKSQLWWDIPAMDSFLLLQKYYEIPTPSFNKKVEEMSSLLDVEDILKVHVRKLSLGERMKLELMASLLHDPKVIFLDEPTIGLDLLAQDKIRAFLKEYQKIYKTTIIITSHYMADVQALCERLVFIYDGEKHFDGPIEQFETILGHKKDLSFIFSSSQDKNNPLWAGKDRIWSEENKKVELKISEETMREFCIEVLQSFPVLEIKTEKMPIEKVMKALMKDPEILKKKN